MTFNSVEFIVLLTCVFFLYFRLPQGWRNPLLLLASFVFYMWWRSEYILLVLLTAGIDYLAALGIHRTVRARVRRLLLAASLGSNLKILFFFKYYSIACDSIRAALGGWGFELPGRSRSSDSIR